MKTFYSLIILSFLFNASVVLADESIELFSETERRDIVKTIDALCGDTWCEGDYNMKFNNFSCNKLSGDCELSFHFIKTNDDFSETISQNQVCHFKEITEIKQIKENYFNLNYVFYNDLNNCISRSENAVTF